MSSQEKAKRPPKYRLHNKKKGLAAVTINGKHIYLGKYGTDESLQKYNRTLAEFLSDSDPVQKLVESAAQTQNITISHLVIEYAKYAKAYYQKNGKPTTEWTAVQLVMKKLRSLYGDTPPSEFGPIRFERFRQVVFVDEGLARSTINHYMLHVLMMFKHAVRLELIPVQCHQRLLTVGTLKKNRTTAREPKRIKPVDEPIVRATQTELTQVVSDMVELQLLCGMRPSEIIRIRPCDIDRSDDVWKYVPVSHKTEHHDIERVVVMGPKAQKVLTPYLLRDHRAFCFTPGEAYEQHQERRNQERKTPSTCGNRARGSKPANLRPCYDSSSYRVAIQRAALRAFPYPDSINKNAAKKKAWREIYKWSPNQLRHSAATLARKKTGLETAQQILGHTQSRTTELVYAETNPELAIEFARKFG